MTREELNARRLELQNDVAHGRFDYEEWMDLASLFGEANRQAAAEAIRRRAEFYKKANFHASKPSD